MKKSELKAVLATKTGKTHKEAEAFIDALEETILEEVKAGKEFKLGNLVKFYPSRVAERSYRNPQGGPAVVKPAHTAVKVKALGEIKDLTL